MLRTKGIAKLCPNCGQVFEEKNGKRFCREQCRRSYHRHDCEIKKIENEQKNSEESWKVVKITAFLGFFVILLTICGSVFCAYHGKETAAVTLGSTAIIAVCGAMVKLIWGKNRND